MTAPSTTWKLVSTWPSRSITEPLPSPLETISNSSALPRYALGVDVHYASIDLLVDEHIDPLFGREHVEGRDGARRGGGQVGRRVRRSGGLVAAWNAPRDRPRRRFLRRPTGFRRAVHRARRFCRESARQRREDTKGKPSLFMASGILDSSAWEDAGSITAVPAKFEIVFGDEGDKPSPAPGSARGSFASSGKFLPPPGPLSAGARAIIAGNPAREIQYFAGGGGLIHIPAANLKAYQRTHVKP